MANETSLGLAFKNAVQSLSKRKQTEIIEHYVYDKYHVFSKFKPLSLDIEQELIKALPQYDSALVSRVLFNHCRRARYLKSVARGGKRFTLFDKFKGEVTDEEKSLAQKQVDEFTAKLSNNTPQTAPPTTE